MASKPLAELAEKKVAESATTGKHGGPRPNSGGVRSGAGRKIGVSNKVTRDLKNMILTALDNVGGVTYLEEVAQNDRKAFCTLISRVLPMTVVGDAQNPVAIQIISGVMRPDDEAAEPHETVDDGAHQSH